MSKTENHLLAKQLDRKFVQIEPLNSFEASKNGWVHQIRKALNMSLRQLGDRLGITPQSTKDLETREVNGSVTLKTMEDFGRSLELKFVYGFIPTDKNIEAMIEERANAKAKEIVQRTSHSMNLENQERSKEQQEKAIKERAQSIKNEMPRYLWD
jgi:predicted DNA-binding mobile mystery protein A